MSIVENKYRGSKEYAIVYSELITVARYKGVVTYQEIAKLIGWPLQGNWMGSAIGHLVGEISDDEVDRGRPMLSAIVVGTSGKPGPGFFELARNLKRLKSGENEADTKFLSHEQKEVYKTWRVILEKKE